MTLYGLHTDNFLHKTWQRTPLLLPQALPDFACPVDGDDLAGLACEPGVESRLISSAGDSWTQENGPFVEDRFQSLPLRDWTLLVQRVDQWLPEVAGLFAHFDFLPRWRLDDVMASVAAPGGSVGPHFDYYDVFLIQGAGEREWRIGQPCDSNSSLQPHPDLRLLRDFEEVSRHTLKPGDVLYIPPGIAHWGTALSENCITLSIGFRAPAAADILSHWCDELIQHLPPDKRYRDTAVSLRSGNDLTPAHIELLRDLLQETLRDNDALLRAFGALITDNGDSDIGAYPVPSDLAQCRPILAPDARLSRYIDDSQCRLFANGEVVTWPLEQSELAGELCAATPGEPIDSTLWTRILNSEANEGIARHLFKLGVLVVDHENS